MTLAFVFPGHGSQSIGMLNSLLHRPEVQNTIQEASDTLNMDFRKLITNGPKEKLYLLTNASPITLINGLSLYRAWIADGGPMPNILAGHSHGEYSALVAAGVISFKDAISIVRFRSKEMSKVNGRVAVIVGITPAVVLELCATVRLKTGKTIEVTNFNAPGQVLISGDEEAVAYMCDACDAKGAKFTKILPLQIPTHSSLLKPVSEKLQEYFKNIEFNIPAIPIINNVDALVLTNPIDIKDAMVRQVSNPVQWQGIIKRMSSIGIKHIVECSAGKVLTELTSRIDNTLQSMAIMDQASISENIRILNLG